MEAPTQQAENHLRRRADGVRSWLKRWAKFYRIAFFPVFLCFAMKPTTASAKVVLLVERGPSIYQEAALGFQRAFSGTDEIDQIYIDADARSLERSLDSLRKNPPRLVVAIGTQAARTAKDLLPNIPILYCLALRPVENQLVGTTIGGIALDIDLAQQLESIQRALPKLRRIGVVYDELTSGPLVRQLQQHLGTNVQLVARDVRTPQEAAREIQDLLSNGLSGDDAFWLLWDSVSANPANFRLLVELSLRYKVPLIAPARPFVEAGALISVGADYERAGRQVAVMAQQVLRGQAQPGNFQAVPPAEVVVTINGEVARRLGIEFPPDLRADILAPAVGARAP
jgi:putative tryptophan/tyrosine transport system substrate-binding protein